MKSEASSHDSSSGASRRKSRSGIWNL
jgi:hypothetical protein